MVPFLDPYYNTAPNIKGNPKRDHNFDNHPYQESPHRGNPAGGHLISLKSPGLKLGAGGAQGKSAFYTGRLGFKVL